MPPDLLSLLANPWFESVLLVVVVVGVRTWLNRRIRGESAVLSSDQRKKLSRSRNASFAVIAAGLLIIWMVQLKTLALSIAAFAVAIVIASKELILCISGSIVVRSGARSFKVGDWIQVGNDRGEVIDHNLFSTTLQEVRQFGNRNYTGHTLVIPNSVFFTQTLVNLNFTKRFVFETFELPVPKSVAWQPLYDRIEVKAEEIVAPLRTRQRSTARRSSAVTASRYPKSGPSFERVSAVPTATVLPSQSSVRGNVSEKSSMSSPALF